MIVVDTNFLVLMIDPASTQDINGRADRVRYFVETLSKTHEEITIPAPALAELVAGRADRVEEIVEAVRGLKAFSVQPFDAVIAIETGERIAVAREQVPEAERLPGWKVAMKYDAMIAATAIVRGARAIYTTDAGFGRYVDGTPVSITMVDDLPLPPEDRQQRLKLD